MKHGRRWLRRHSVSETGKVRNIRPMLPDQDGANTTVNAHGICRTCNKRTWLWLPGRICTKCMEGITELFQAEQQRQMEAALLDALELELEEGAVSV